MAAHFLQREYLMNVLSLATLTTKDDFSSMDEMPQLAFAVPAVVQADTSVNVNNSLGALE
ncbi:hypothetical protein H0G86_009888 [Trichoderma simmonsii]|uniref:Uncharacterized protein n=1 Tax=Trichoderma simmonsii TaxID=1491479 RepID=A0A8G0LMS2_9HYPO|nr:hypothetical protein H0G86_009888 [Trichoderma simmonsii]